MTQDRLQKLLAKREDMNAKIRQEQGRDRKRKRSQDTRKKIIAGALVLAEQDPVIQAWLDRTVAKLLTRNDDRALFGLAPLSGAPSPAQPADKPASAAGIASEPEAARSNTHDGAHDALGGIVIPPAPETGRPHERG